MCLFSLPGVAADIPIASPIFPAPDLGCLASPTVQRTGCFQFASCLLGERRGKAFEKCKVEAPVAFYPPNPTQLTAGWTEYRIQGLVLWVQEQRARQGPCRIYLAATLLPNLDQGLLTLNLFKPGSFGMLPVRAWDCRPQQLGWLQPTLEAQEMHPLGQSCWHKPQAEKGQARTALGAVCEPAGCLHGKMKLSERWLQLDCREIMEKRLTSIKESLK